MARALVIVSQFLLASPSANVWCSVPNYRFYRFTPEMARGFGPSSTSHCGLAADRPDGCICSLPSECRSGYCLPDAASTVCSYPVYQVSEVEFWRGGQPIQLTQQAVGMYDAFRVMNAVDVAMTWGIWELEFYNDTNCSSPMLGGEVIFSSDRPRGFGHINPYAMQGPNSSTRTAWQSSHEVVEGLELHGPAAFAFDGDLTTNWWAGCSRPCRARTEWLGRRYTSQPAGLLRCLRVAQAGDRGYASERLAVQGRRAGGGWETLAELGTWEAAPGAGGAPWQQLSLPQGAGFPWSVAHGRVLDGNLSSSVVEVVGTPLDFDLGQATEIDAWRWATAEEPLDFTAGLADPFLCAHDGRCPRDPVRWRLEGSLDQVQWVTLQRQDTDFPVTVHRRQFIPFQPVLHQVSMSIADIWPDGRSTCAARR